MVQGRQDKSPATGPYTSCGRSLIQARGSKLDLIFAIDTTGSMYDDIAKVKSSATEIINEIAGGSVDYRIGVITYRDHPVSPYGSPSDYLAVRKSPSAPTIRQVIWAINNIVVGGGADIDEAVCSGLMHAIAFPWRDGVKKSIILMGDAGPHDPEPYTGYTLSSVVSAALAVDPANIYAVKIGTQANMVTKFNALATQTEGETFSAPNAAAITSVLMSAIETISNSPFAVAGGPYMGGLGLLSPLMPVTRLIGMEVSPPTKRDFNNDGIHDLTTANARVTYSYANMYDGILTCG